MTDKGCEQLFKKLLHRKGVVDADVFGHADAPDKILVERVVRATKAGLEGPGLADHHFEKHFKADKARRRCLHVAASCRKI